MPRRCSGDSEEEDEDYLDYEDDDADFDEDPVDPEPDDEEPTVPCPYCRKQIHEDAQRCPYCERYISQEDAPYNKPWWLLLGVGVCLFIVFCWILC